MSYYRPPKAFTDQDVCAPVSPDAAAARIPPAPRESISGYAHLRKSNPVNYVLPPSRKWLDNLPPDVRPISLVEKYPRIVNLIALEWDNPSAIGALLTDLLVDQRGGRDGLPVAVRHELQALRDYQSLARSPAPARGTDDTRPLGTYKRRARLLRIARAVQWLGVVWNFSWWGYALLESRRSLTFSDAIEDATPLFFLGGIGFGVAYFVAWLIRNRAKRGARR